MLEDQLKYHIALWYTPTIGTRKYLAICQRFPDLSDFFQQPQQYVKDFKLSNAAQNYLSQPDWSEIDIALAWQARPNYHIITLNDPLYPQLLKNIASPPAVLFVQGDVHCLSDPQLAIVGSRFPSPYGKDNAMQFAKEIVSDGMTVTSGMAIGIDTAAHRGALTTGQTIAVLGSGFEHIYPQQNTKLAEQIAQSGAVISEFPLNAPVAKHHFPRRNRIISGLSLGTLVIEATLHSGALITAKQAVEQGREVFAIPGTIHTPQSKGCHSLIRQGAKLVESAYDILIEIKPALQNRLAEPIKLDKSDANESNGITMEYQQLLAQINFEPTPVDLIIAKSQLTASEVSSMLPILELKNYISPVAGGYARIQ